MAGRKVKEPAHKKKKTVSNFQIYKAEVERLLAKTQTGGGWDIMFRTYNEKPRANGSATVAQVDINCPNRYAIFMFNKHKAVKMDEAATKSHARHEFGHFVTGRLAWLANCRYLNEEDLTEEGEAIAMVFQKLC